MKAGATVFAAVMLAIGLGYEWKALKMPRGTFAYPGPGLFPVLVGIFLSGAALWCLVQELRKRAAESDAHQAAGGQGGRDVKKTFQLTALTVAFILLLKPLGYPICICAFLVAAIRIFGYRRWLPTVAMAGLIAAI